MYTEGLFFEILLCFVCLLVFILFIFLLQGQGKIFCSGCFISHYNNSQRIIFNFFICSTSAHARVPLD